MPSRERVAEFVAAVEAGRYVEALESFYAVDAAMQENQEAPRVGRDVLVATEKFMLQGFKAITTRPVEKVVVDGDHVVINWIFDFQLHDGTSFVLEEIAFQQWCGDVIIKEQFYYDPAQRTPRH